MRIHHFVIIVLGMLALAGIFIPGFVVGAIKILLANMLWAKILAVMVLIFILYQFKPIRYTGIVGLLVVLSPLILWGLYELVLLAFNEAGKWLIIIPAAIILLLLIYKFGRGRSISVGRIIPSAGRSWDIFVWVFLCGAMLFVAFYVYPSLRDKIVDNPIDNALYGNGSKSNATASVGQKKTWTGTNLPTGDVKFKTTESFKWEHDPNADVYMAPKNTGDKLILKYYNTTRGTSWTQRVIRKGPGKWDFDTQPVEGISTAAVGDKILVTPQNTVDGVSIIDYN